MLSQFSSCFLSIGVSSTGCSRLASSVRVRVKMSERQASFVAQRMKEAAKEETGLVAKEDIDRSKFIKRMRFQAVSVPKKMSQIASHILSGYVLDMPRVKHIVADPADDDSRLIILSDAITSCLDGLPQEKLGALKKVVDLKVVSHEVVLDYTYWPVEHILKSILPDGLEVPTSFETIGHIAHLNLRDELLPYRKVIAKVILDKNTPKIKTVVNKVGTISNEFRVPALEILAGESSLITKVKQHRATFKLDYSLVYWNSRLEHEHNRLTSQFRKGQVVVDMFAGVGPFAIPAAQQGCTVFANDLNPDSVKYLEINVSINRVSSRVFPHNMDARHFMQKLMKCSNTRKHSDREGFSQQSLTDFRNAKDSEDHDTEFGNIVKVNNLSSSKGKVQETEEVKPWEHFDHAIMNLPASAIQFLDVFQGLMSREYWRGPLPRVHCYCFMHLIESMEDIVRRAEKVMKGSICKPDCYVVRDVAPNKIMLCLSFQLPESVAFHETVIGSTHEADEHNTERPTDECGSKRTRVL